MLTSRRAFGVARSQLCFGYTETLAPFMLRIQGEIFLMLRIRKTDNAETLDKGKDHIKKKGGRPPKAVQRDQLLGVKCTLIERRAIEARARSANLTVSEYLREMGLKGKIDMRQKAIPKEVLELKGTMNHTAANINQIAKKRNQGDDLNALDRATLQQLPGIIQEWDRKIKAYLQ